jgi:monoamine oxidase
MQWSGTLEIAKVGQTESQTVSLSLPDRKQAVLNAIRDFYGPKALEPLAYIEQNWTAEPYNGGCPVPHLPPGVLSQYGAHMRAPCGRIHWAGVLSID